jgi:hypothetical protein
MLGGARMKWMGIYLLGYVLFIAGVIAALWKLGVLEHLGPAWVAIGVLMAIGVGIMISVSSSGEKKTLEIDQK